MTLVELVGGPMDGVGYQWPGKEQAVQMVELPDQPIYRLTKSGRALHQSLIDAARTSGLPIKPGDEVVP